MEVAHNDALSWAIIILFLLNISHDAEWLNSFVLFAFFSTISTDKQANKQASEVPAAAAAAAAAAMPLYSHMNGRAFLASFCKWNCFTTLNDP